MVVSIDSDLRRFLPAAEIAGARSGLDQLGDFAPTCGRDSSRLELDAENPVALAHGAVFLRNSV
jgi:hypothetical protein